MEQSWSPAPAQGIRKGGADLEPATAGRGADGLFFSCGRPGWLGSPPGACRGECHNLFVHTTPADRNVSLWRGALPEIREEASALRRSARRGGRERPCSKLLLAGDDGCPFQRNGGLVTTMLSREGRSLRMTFRMCRISSRRGARSGALARRQGIWRHQPDAEPLPKADGSASSDSRKKLDARLAGKVVPNKRPELGRVLQASPSRREKACKMGAYAITQLSPDSRVRCLRDSFRPPF